jgi:hypothetical protein
MSAEKVVAELGIQANVVKVNRLKDVMDREPS